MASFPTFAKMYVESAEELQDDLRADRTTNGTLKSRSFYTATKRRFTPKFLLTKTERDTLTTFYNTNKLLNITFVWAGDGQTYTCRFAQAPRYTYNKTGDLNAECVIQEV